MTGIPAGTHAFGPADGELRNVFREGAAARIHPALIVRSFVPGAPA